jgi:hypothetical protein
VAKMSKKKVASGYQRKKRVLYTRAWRFKEEVVQYVQSLYELTMIEETIERGRFDSEQSHQLLCLYSNMKRLLGSIRTWYYTKGNTEYFGKKSYSFMQKFTDSLILTLKNNIYFIECYFEKVSNLKKPVPDPISL